MLLSLSMMILKHFEKELPLQKKYHGNDSFRLNKKAFININW